VAQPRKTVTSLRSVRPGRVLVHLDGEPWRTLPLEALVRAGIGVGAELDRQRLRVLRRELRRLEALDVATAALRSSDRSAAEITGRLAARGVAGGERERALGTLERAGLVDDARLARSRAGVLAQLGAGNALIRDDLERRGLGADEIAAALAALDPEAERAARLAAVRGPGVKTARYLVARGFAEEAVEAVVADWPPGAIP